MTSMNWPNTMTKNRRIAGVRPSAHLPMQALKSRDKMMNVIMLCTLSRDLPDPLLHPQFGTRQRYDMQSFWSYHTSPRPLVAAYCQDGDKARTNLQRPDVFVQENASDRPDAGWPWLAASHHRHNLYLASAPAVLKYYHYSSAWFSPACHQGSPPVQGSLTGYDDIDTATACRFLRRLRCGCRAVAMARN